MASNMYLHFFFYSFVMILLQRVDADYGKSVSELIMSRGFNVDEFDVISNNYILKVYRIINPLADPNTLHKVPVVATHGISFDMASMMANSKLSRPRQPRVHERVTLYAIENGTDDRGLYFYLSNNNYDVWLLEARAVSDRVMHRLSDGGNAKSFWDFSIDEQALFDLPLQIEFVLKRTGASKVAYIAFSQSTTMMFALLSMRPEFSKKLATFIAIAPVFYTTSMKSRSIILSVLTRIFLKGSSAVGFQPSWLRRLGNSYFTYLCWINLFKKTLCRYLWTQLSGPLKGDPVLEGGITEGALKSTSAKSYEQFIENRRLGEFRMFDYKDETRNMEEYGQPVPPLYNISKIDFPNIVLFRGTNDYLSDPKDQMILMNRLGVPLYEDHILEEYSHIDFIVSSTVARDINEPILRILDKLTNRTVTRVSHTFGNPNPTVEGIQMVVDIDPAKERARENNRRENSYRVKYPSVSKSETPVDGLDSKANVTTVKEELLGKKKKG